LQRGDRFRQAADLEESEAEIVLDDRAGRLQQRGVAQGWYRFGWLAALEQISG
jgi:hypothetical protein